jgi:hypothetical protein
MVSEPPLSWAERSTEALRPTPPPQPGSHVNSSAAHGAHLERLLEEAEITQSQDSFRVSPPG